MRNRKRNQIDLLLAKAEDLALQEIEKRARRVMREHPRCASFMMCMGSADFIDKNGEFISVDTKYLWKKFYSFLYEYDTSLHLSGCPMKIIGHDGKRLTDW